MNHSWDWSFFNALNYDGQTYLSLAMSCWGWTFKISAGAWIIALLIGGLIGTIRTLPNHKLLAFIGNAWVDIFRNIPVLVQVFLWIYVLPQIIIPLQVLRPHPFIMVICALGFFTSARIAEQVKAGIQAIPRGQRDAAKALGLNTFQTYLYVLVPIATRIIMPPLTSEAMNIVKNSAVAMVLPNLPELMYFATQPVEETQRFFEIYIVVTIMFIITSLVFNRVMRFIEIRLRVPGLASNAAGGH